MKGTFATVMRGPANLMAAYKALVSHFGDSIDVAADYVWKAYKKGVAKQAAAQVEWYPPDADFESAPKGPKPFDPYEGTKTHTPRTMESLEDAADTVAHSLVSEEKLRTVYVNNMSHIHELDSKGKSTLLDRSIPKINNELKSLVPLQTESVGTSVKDFKNFMISNTSETNDPEQTFQKFLEYVFKLVFKTEYKSMQKKIMSGTSRWASVKSVVQKYVEGIQP